MDKAQQGENGDVDDEEVPADPWERMTPAEKEARMSSLVSALPIEEWGKRPDPPKVPQNAAVTPAGKSTNGPAGPTSPSQNKKSTPSMFKQDFDGVESDSGSEDEDDEGELPAAGTLGRKIAQMRWSEGAPRIEEIADPDEDQNMDNDDAADEDEEDRLDRQRDASLRWDDNIDEAMRKRVWGDAGASKEKAEDRPVLVNADEPIGEEDGDGEEMDLDMVNEMNDFLTFARETLGVGEDQWDGIVKSREARGGE